VTVEQRSGQGARLVALLVLVTGAALLAFLLIVDRDSEDFADFFLVPAAVAFTAVGALIIARSEGNRVGWVVSAAGLGLLAGGVIAYFDDKGIVVAAAANSAFWFSFLFLVGLLIYWFPTGEPVTPMWRWVGWIGFLSQMVNLTFIVSEEICLEGVDVCEVWVDNPIGITGVPNPEYGSLAGVSLLFLAGFVLLSAVSLIVRWVRARGVERLQIKWFAFAVVFAIGSGLLLEALRNLVSVPDLVWELVMAISMVALPVSIGVAVLRYHLYEIDRIVSRTVSYAVVVGVLAVVFFGVVTVLTSLLPAESDLAVAGSTLAVAALFNPVRKRVQVWVDRRFNRSRYDAQKVMDGFAGSLRDRVDPDGVVEGWVRAVSETMQPSTVAVWVREATAAWDRR